MFPQPRQRAKLRACSSKWMKSCPFAAWSSYAPIHRSYIRFDRSPQVNRGIGINMSLRCLAGIQRWLYLEGLWINQASSKLRRMH